jgi:outer membrane murein-binding lipoprotein Lpp
MLPGSATPRRTFLLTRSARTHRFILAAALSAALVGAGCGGESEEDKAKEYSEALTEAHGDFNRELTQAGATMQAAGRANSREQYEQGVEQLQSAADDFKKELDDLDTPEDAENEEQAAIEAVDEFASAVGRINAAVQAEDRDQIRSEAASVQTSGAAVDQAIKTLKEAVD